MENVFKKQVILMKSCWIENLGKGKFQIHELPMEAQMAPIYATYPIDINQDGYMDFQMVGNDFGIEVQQGKADALNGLTLLNKKGKSFSSIPFTKSGFFVPGDGKSLVSIHIKDKIYLIIGQNKDRALIFKLNNIETPKISFKVEERYAIVYLKDGSKQKIESYWGNSFYSQSGNFIPTNKQTAKIEFRGVNGKLMRTWKSN